jgi:ribonuclease HI
LTKKPKATNGVKTYTASEIDAMDINTKIYTDGGCEPNPGKAGSGIAVYRNEAISELWYGLFNPNGTNNTAELNGLFYAMRIAEHEVSQGKTVAIFCDSKYSIQCITQWAAGWQKKGWKRPSGEIKNLELIKKMFALYMTIKNKAHILHVNGHVGVEGNELADRMSILAIEHKEDGFKLYNEDKSQPIDVKGLLALRTG